MLERQFQAKLIKQIKDLETGVVVLKIDPTVNQGFPDLLVLYEDKWAMLEVKQSIHSPYRPNQQHYIWALDQMSFCRMICPENEYEVMNELCNFLFCCDWGLNLRKEDD